VESGKLLGDLGADVIKIEPPGGDPVRSKGPFYKDVPDAEKSLRWFYSNLNKRGITLDIAAADGKELFKKLVQTADFVIESFNPGYMRSLDLGYEALERIKPSIIVTAITSFGRKGPYADYKTTDLVGVSMGGLARLFGELVGPPVRISTPQFYYLGSIHAAMGSMVSLYHREITGEGQYVDVSCQQAVVLANRISVETYDLLNINPRGVGPNTPVPRPTPPGPIFIPIVKECKDGHVVAFILGGSQAGFVKSTQALVAWANEEGMAMELKYRQWDQMDASEIDQEYINNMHEPIDAFLLTKTKAELLDKAIKKEILLIPVTTISDLAESEQLSARQFWNDVRHPELDDTLVYPGWPIKWTELPAYAPQCRAPLLGEHNRDIYEKELGHSKDELILLKTQGVI